MQHRGVALLLVFAVLIAVAVGCGSSAHAHRRAASNVNVKAAPRRVHVSAALAAAAKAASTNAKPADVFYGFPLGSVHVDPTSVPGVNQQTTLAYLKSLDVDRFLYYFRVQAGLPTGDVKPYGGWESQPWVYGHFVGHYLSACAQMYSSLGDETLLAKATALVQGFAECQAATSKKAAEMNGFFAAMNYSDYTSFRTFTSFNYPCSTPGYYLSGAVPFYTMHKYMNGLWDWAQAVDAEDPSGETAAAVLEGLSLWTAQFINATIALGTHWQWDEAMQVEFGGMNDVLYAASTLAPAANVSAEQQQQMFVAGDQFTKSCFFGPLAVHSELLDSLHANTHVPQVIGYARRYEMTGSEIHASAVKYFWDVVTNTRAYATGGSSHGEHWYSTDLSNQLGTNDQETCVSYNLAKLTRMLLRWSGDAKYSSYYHRIFYNGLLGTIDTSVIGRYLYYTPLSTGVSKNWGDAENTFWCCYGTGIENWSKVGDSIYFTDATGQAAVYVNLFFSSTLDVYEDITLEQTATFPVSNQLKFTWHNPSAVAYSATLNVLMPWYVTAGGVTISINGGAAQAASTSPVSYLTIAAPAGAWKDGDTVVVTIPLSFYAHYMPDNANMFAVMYGPLVLVGEVANAKLNVNPHVHPPSEWMQVVSASGNKMTFSTVNSTVSVASAPITFLPINQLTTEKYTTYFTGLTTGSSSSSDSAVERKAARVPKSRKTRRL